MNFLIMPNLDKANTVSCVQELRRCFSSDEHKLMYQSQYQKQLAEYGDLFDDDIDRLMHAADVVIAIGGDGTVIHTAKLAAEAGKPIIGINSGYLGFTAELEPDEMSCIIRLTEGDLPIEKRMMLEVRVLSADGKEKLRCNAINDAVITRGALARIITLNVMVDDRPALSYRADGLIVSTPTGSTAYALSAGGPIISPQINCIPVTPICPHDLSSRTIVFSDASTLCISTGAGRGNVMSDIAGGDIYLTVDGESACPLSHDDRVEIKKSPIYALFIKLKKIGFSETLKSKFNY